MSEASADRNIEDLEDLYENAPCGYVSLSPDGLVVKVNQTLARWLGAGSDALLGQSIHALLSFGGRIAYETHLAPLLRLQGFVDEIALDLLRPDGEKIPVIANAAEKRDDTGQHLFTRLTLFKAVDRRTYERGLLAARTRAEQVANEEHETSILREQFIAVLGHDLRNPLAAIAAGVNMLDRRESLSERGHNIVGEVNASISRANALIGDVLDLARGRLGNGLVLDRNAEQPFTPVLEQVVAEIRAASPTRQILVDIAIEEPLDCDRGRLAQLASNLLANAVTHGAKDTTIRLRAWTSNECFTLSVSNEGAPIPAAARARLFQPFFRGAVRESQQGLGLGLYIVSEIAKAHGGSMEVSSSDQETQFVFSMPPAKEAAGINVTI